MLTRSEFLGALAAAAATRSHSFALPGTSALDRYIARPTPEYSYEVVRVLQGRHSRARVVRMVSQQWRTAREVDKPLWTHWLTITEPEQIKTRIGLLVVSGGSNTDEPPSKVSSIAETVAFRTGAVVAELHSVPNQPLTFAGDGIARGEDDLVAYSWDRYLHTGDETWPMRLPMTKSVVRAMDTVSALSPVDRFVVGGASKRGWTTWLTPAVDNRVVAIVPVVIDVLNIAQSAEHAFRVYGFWPEALEPYAKMGIMKWFGTPQLQSLFAIEDPYAYRRRITVPKLIVNATGDQFFTPDSSQFYYDGLFGEKYLRYVPNTDHSLKGVASNAAETGIAFLNTIIADGLRPRYAWQFDGPGTIRVRSATRPISVKLWQAENAHSRDFRLQTIGPAFSATELRDEGGFTYSGTVSTPRAGFVASFVELTYPSLHEDIFTVTSGVRVTPDVLPYAFPA